MEVISGQRPARKWVRDTQLTVDSSRRSVDFIKEHRLWEGFKSYRWFVKALVVVGVFLGIRLFFSLDDLLGAGAEGQQAALSSYFNGLTLDSISSYFGGGLKYVILIALELIIFHFTRRTMMVVTGEHIDTSFKTFIKAEKRMILVAIFSIIMEALWKFGANTVLSIFGLADTLEWGVGFLIQSFYLGFAIVDNYNELFHMTIRQSHRYSLQYAPVVFITGAILFAMLEIPIIGVILGPVICAVIATLTMHQISTRDTDMAWVYVEKEKKKKKKRRRKKK